MYYDSTMNSTDFLYVAIVLIEKVKNNILSNALYNTLINTHSLDYNLITWNDGNPITGKTASAPTAHSKGIIALDENTKHYKKILIYKYI